MSMLRELRAERELREERAPVTRRADLRLVTSGTGLRRGRLARVLTVLAAATACAVMFGIVCIHVMLTQGQAELDQLEARAAQAEASGQKLRVQVAELESPQRVVTAARERMGMIPPPTVVYLIPGGPRLTAPTTTTPMSGE